MITGLNMTEAALKKPPAENLYVLRTEYAQLLDIVSTLNGEMSKLREIVGDLQRKQAHE
jgi:hypothetical protein